jgi:hypothetical protein
MPDRPNIVLVGHCGPDISMMKSAISRAAPGVSVSVANNARTLEAQLGPKSILLINRVLDGGFDTDSGTELIEHFARAGNPPAMMLISDFDEAQREAVAAGSQPGFGKSQLYNESTARKLRDALSRLSVDSA